MAVRLAFDANFNACALAVLGAATVVARVADSVTIDYPTSARSGSMYSWLQ